MADWQCDLRCLWAVAVVWWRFEESEGRCGGVAALTSGVLRAATIVGFFEGSI